jgi:endothelin-converting enzyme
MSDVNRNMLHSILEGDYSENTTTIDKSTDKENFAKMKLAYNACKDEVAIKKYGVTPLRKILDDFETMYPLAGLPTTGNDELTKTVIWLAKNSVSGFVSAGVGVSPFPRL